MNARIDAHRVTEMPKLTEADLDAHEAERLPVPPPRLVHSKQPGLKRRRFDRADLIVIISALAAFVALMLMTWLEQMP